MYFSILILLLSRSRGQDYGVEENKKCDIVVFQYEYFDRQIMFYGYGKAYSLYMHEISGDLFISRASKQEALDHRQIMVCNSRKDYCTYVSGMTNGYTIAYDTYADELFFGGTDGIYQYNFFLHKAVLIAAEGVHIWDIFIHRVSLYYVVHPTQRLYRVDNRQFDGLELVIYTEVDHFYVTKVNNRDIAYITNKTGIYKLVQKPMRQTVLSNNTEIQVRQISKDTLNNVYFATNQGVYQQRKEFKRIMRVAINSQVYGMTIINVKSPKKNLIVIYSDEKNIYRLLSSDDVDCINDYIAKRKKHNEKKKTRNNTLRFSLKLFR